jgi:hypothetical protein
MAKNEIDFSQFDKAVDKNKLAEQIKEAKENGGGEDTPKGEYCGVFEKFEMRTTKDKRPMFSCQFRIKGTYDEDGKLSKKYAKKCVFMNRVIMGTKNDGNMINSLLGWLKKLECDFDIEFESYSQFNNLIMDIFEDISGVEFDIEYDEDKFNSITILGETTDVPF